MTLQSSPRKAPPNIDRVMDELDRAAGLDRLPPRQEIAPSYGGPQRDAIASVVDGIVGDICSKIEALRKMLDVIEQQVLQSAAKSKHSLNDHVATCVRLNDEITHTREVIDEIAEHARDQS